MCVYGWCYYFNIVSSCVLWLKPSLCCWTLGSAVFIAAVAHAQSDLFRVQCSEFMVGVQALW